MFEGGNPGGKIHTDCDPDSILGDGWGVGPKQTRVPPRKNPLSFVANNNKCLKKALSLKLPNRWLMC